MMAATTMAQRQDTGGIGAYSTAPQVCAPQPVESSDDPPGQPRSVSPRAQEPRAHHRGQRGADPGHDHSSRGERELAEPPSGRWMPIGVDGGQSDRHGDDRSDGSRAALMAAWNAVDVLKVAFDVLDHPIASSTTRATSTIASRVRRLTVKPPRARKTAPTSEMGMATTGIRTARIEERKITTITMSSVSVSVLRIHGWPSRYSVKSYGMPAFIGRAAPRCRVASRTLLITSSVLAAGYPDAHERRDLSVELRPARNPPPQDDVGCPPAAPRRPILFHDELAEPPAVAGSVRDGFIDTMEPSSCPAPIARCSSPARHGRRTPRYRGRPSCRA